MQDTRPLLLATDFPAMTRRTVSTLQVNLGYLCNQSCTHCHVNAGPTRTELMGRETVDLVLKALAHWDIGTLDLTGGAPELNPHFRDLVTTARARDVRVIDRCNLTVLSEPGQATLAEFLAEQRVSITASLPCYLEDNVDAQRGKGVYQRSIDGLLTLNALGYGMGSGLELNLVYNPTGPSLPPPQAALEAQYKEVLRERFNIEFDHLLTLTNLPVSRFGAVLLAKGEFTQYMRLLRENYQAQNLESVMCRDLISVDWQGYLYDCDFNQMLDLPLAGKGERPHLADLMTTAFVGEPIAVGQHCYGCTAGQGSSCSGALAQ